MERISLLIVTQALGYGIGGSEKALIEMLKAFDTEKYVVTVLSLSEAPERPYVDDRMTIIYGEKSFLKITAPLRTGLLSSEYSLKEKFVKCAASLYCRMHKGDFSKALWKLYRNQLPALSTVFDVAIGYGVGFATYYVIDKVSAKVKIAWLNTSLADAHLDLDFCRKYYERYDAVVTDSKSGEERFNKLYPSFGRPTHTVRNLLDANELRSRGDEGEAFKDNYTGTRILSVGRLAEAKAFHYAVDAAKILKDKGYGFRWYIVGFGCLEESLRKQIKENGLEDIFFLLGSKTNPYPFFKACDIYVQTSIFEGSCITIEEAMAFYKPIVTTNFEAAFEKVIDGKNGIITEMDANSIASGVEKLLIDKSLRNIFSDHQRKFPLSYEEEMNKLYSIFDRHLSN